MSEQQSNAPQQPQATEAEGFSLLDEIMEQTKLAPDDESYTVAKRGVEAFIAEMLAPKSAYEKADKIAVDQMIAEIDRGLLVTELIGMGFNPTTGDYSRGAAGLWIEQGEIVHPVEEITFLWSMGGLQRTSG